MNNGKNIITPQINYEMLVEEALRAVVRSSLRIAEENGLPGETHFYITFLTGENGVIIPDALREKHPDRMTIVIQHQYRDLKVAADRFSVTLTFAGVPETLTIPFSAVVDFNDPSVGFGLQFAAEDEMPPMELGGVADNGDGRGGTGRGNAKASGTADVVSLDAFRKKT